MIEKSVLKKIKSDFWSHLIIPGSLFCKINTPVHLAVCSKPFFYNCRLPEDTESCFHLCKRKSLMKGGLGFITCLHEVMSTQQVECVCRNSSTMRPQQPPSSSHCNAGVFALSPGSVGQVCTSCSVCWTWWEDGWLFAVFSVLTSSSA